MWLFAHGIVGRADLPIPVFWFAVAAAAVLVVSFLALAAGWERPILDRPRERPLFRLPLVVEVLLGALGVLVFAVTVYAGLAGTDSQQDNLAPTAVYVGFWVGVPFLTLLFGDVFRLLSPWRAIGRATGWLAKRAARDAMPEPLAYPERLGHWPAVAGLIAFAICELCWAAARDPQPLAVLMLIYLAIQLFGMSLYGVEPWVRRGDAFGVWFGLLARLAPLGRRGDGRLVLRPPVVGATGLVAIAGTTALLLSVIGSTAFDGAKEGPLFNDLVGEMQDGFASLGLSLGLGARAVVRGRAGDLAGRRGRASGSRACRACRATGSRAASSRAASPTRSSRSPRPTSSRTTSRCSPTAASRSGRWPTIRSATAPTSSAAPARAIDYSVVSATGIWYVQIGALVVGHVAALVLAHDRALVVYGSSRAAARSQIVMLIVMVMFTVLGLWLLSAALNL